MNQIKRSLQWIVVLSLIFTVGFSIKTYADISGITVDFSDNNTEETPVVPAIEINGNYDRTIVWNKPVEKWVPGKSVIAIIRVVTTEGVFKSSYGENLCRINGARFISAKSEDGETLVIKASYIPVVKLGETEKAGWSDAQKTSASWKKVPYATGYQLQLYQDDMLIKTLTVSGTSVDLREYMKDGFSYYYEVRAIGKTQEEKAYLKTGGYVTSQDSLIQELGDTEGYWRRDTKGWRYMDPQGNESKSCWKMISGIWYYFNQDGYALTGWNYINQQWYYMDQECRMLTGWQQVGGIWYYMESDGHMLTGWFQQQPEVWYYLNDSGAMCTGENHINNQKYCFGTDGILKENN